jgi:hypothetical protein
MLREALAVTKPTLRFASRSCEGWLRGRIFALILPVLFLSGCAAAPVGSREAQVRSELNSIGDAYHKCVGAMGENSPQCQALANGIDQVASNIDSAQSTGAMLQMENAARREMGH